MKCKNAQEKILDSLTGNLDARDVEELEAHIATCAVCRAEAESYRELWSDLGEIVIPKPGSATLGRLAEDLAESQLRMPDADRVRSPARARRAAQSMALAASLLVGFVGGYLVSSAGLARTEIAVTPAPAQGIDQQFLLLLREPEGALAPVGLTEADLVSEYAGWAGQLASDGILMGAEKLANDPGVWLVGRDGPRSGTAQPDITSAPFISGFFLIRAADYGEAVEVARQSPHLAYGGTIELREIDRR